MIDPSNIWLKALIIEVASCPLMYVWTVIFVNIQIFIGRNTGRNKRFALWLIIVAIFAPGILTPWMVALKFGNVNFVEKHDWAFFIWVTFLLILSLIPSYLYMFRKRRRDLKEVGYAGKEWPQ